MLRKDRADCNLFQTQIYDDLISPSYLYYDGSGGLSSKFGSSSQSLFINNFSSMTNLIDSSVEEEVWTPAFTNATTLSTMPYIDGIANRNPILGINEFFVLGNPIFKNISVQNNVKVGIDWFLNDPLNRDITPVSGILFWYKKRGTRNASLPIVNISSGEWIYSSSAFTIKNISNKEITIPAGQICVKLNDKELQILPINKNTNTNNQILRNIYIADNPLGSQNNIYEPSKINLETCTNPPATWSIYNEFNYLKVGDSYYSIHIGEGDYFSYTDTNNVLDYFLSFNLMSIYRVIYNNLLNITGITNLSANQAKRLKQLSFALATGPQNDKVTLNINGFNTSSYISTITSFLNLSDPNATNSSITTICRNVYKEIQHLEQNRIYNTSLVPYKTEISELNSNYSKVPNDIFHQLVFKYGLYIRFAGDDAKITVNKLLKWKKTKNTSSEYAGGPNVSIDSRYIYWTQNRDIIGEANSPARPNNVGHPFYDQHIQAGPMRIETDLGQQNVYFKSLDTGSEEAKTTAKLNKFSENPFSVASENIHYLLLPEIKYSMFYKQGGFKILNSTCYITEPIGAASLYNGKLDNKPIFLDISKLSSRWNSGNNKEYHFSDSDPDEYKKVSLKFKLYNSNDVIKLDSLYINFLRYKEETLCSCESFYRELINRSENNTKNIVTNSFLGIDVSEETLKRIAFSRAGYCEDIYLGANASPLYKSSTPGVSTRFSPPVIAYGGYDPAIISELGIRIPGHPSPGQKLPTLDTRNPVYLDEVKCYERSGYVEDASYFSHTQDNTSSEHMIGTTVFNKGFFHPHHGWISSGHSWYSNFKNRTAVVSHKPNKKSRFVFKGIGFLFNSPNTNRYSSTVSISKGAEITTAAETILQTGMRGVDLYQSKYSSEYYSRDCIPYRGERNSDGSFTSGGEQLRDNSCDNNYQPKVDYGIYPLWDNASSTQVVSSEDLDSIRIKDIEIKLNFVNFDNIQDIKLTLKYTGSPSDGTRPSSYYGLVSNAPFNNETNINNYVTALANQNPSDTIILLNKEHIKQYGNDFTLRFSDYASPFAFHNPLNKIEDGEINHSSLLNTGVANGEALHPSFKPDGYTDKQTQFYRELLNTYNVCIIDNKFRKWYGSPLIGSKFVLEVELVNQYSKINYGNIPDTHLKNNKTEESLKSNIAKNSICSWEIILDTYRTDDAAHRKEQRLNINHPAAEHIDYTRTSDDMSTTASEYADGYNFLGDFSDRKFLVPPVNMNAPHQYLTDFNSCIYPEEAYNNWGFSRLEPISLRYYYQAVNLLSAGIGFAVGFAAGGGLSGAFVGMSLFGAASDLATRSLVSYYAAQRRAALVDSYDETFYDPSYDEYGYGLPDSAMVEVSVDRGATWYLFEAKIFKYNKYCSPVYKPLNINYEGAGDTSSLTSSKLSTSMLPLSPSSTSPISVDPDSFSMPESFILNGQYIKAKELNIRKNIRLLDSKPNVLNHSNIFIGQNTYDPASTVCIELPFVKPFYYLKSSSFGISTSVDIIYYDLSGPGYKNIHTQTLNNICVLNKDNKYNTYLLFNNEELKTKLEKNIGCKLLVQKSNAEDLLSVNLIGGGGYLTLASIKALSSNVFEPEYTMPVYGEASWGRGTASIDLFPAKKIIFADDYNLSDFAIGYSHNRYVGRVKLANNTVISTSLLNIGLFDNINGWPLYKNIEKYNLHKILSDNIQYPYKNTSALNSIFSLYTTSVVDNLKNKDLPSKGKVKLLDHLVPAKIGQEQEKIIEEGCLVEAIYSNQEVDGAICYGSHQCNGAKFNVSINGIFLFAANLNNSGEGSPPDPPLGNGVGLDPLDRYSAHTITAAEADAINEADPGNIQISYAATEDNPNPHTNITWIRVLSPSGEEIASTCAESSGLSTKPEEYSDDKYWISIDKYQHGVHSRTTSIKVLDKIEYRCSEPATRPGDLNCKNICGMSPTYATQIRAPSGGLEWEPVITTPIELMKVNIKSTPFNVISAERNSDPTAIFTNVQADQHKAAILLKYPNIKWEKITYNRPDVRVSCGGSQRDTVMFITEHYWISVDTHTGSGDEVRATEILDSTDDILVRFQYRSRKLRHVDNLFKKYVIKPNGSFSYNFRFGFDEMAIKNSFYSWFCNYIDRGTNTLNNMVPPYYMMLNEMIFRGFFGSADGLEIKNNTSKTQYAHEWIPYEYDNSIQCSTTVGDSREDTAPMSASNRPDSIGYRLRCWLLSKLVSSPYDKKKIVSNCLSYMRETGGPGIVPDKKEFDYLYERKDTSIGRPRIQELIDRFLG